MGKSQLHDDIDALLQRMSNRMHEEEENKEPGPENIETIHVFPVEGGLLILRDEEVNKPPVVESELVPIPHSAIPARSKAENIGFTLFLIFACLFWAYIILGFLFASFFLPTATITVMPLEHTISEKQVISVVTKNPGAGEIEGQVFAQTLSLSKSVPTTGRGHQNAAYARGAITFYNGLLSLQTIPQGTTLTGRDGIQVVTDVTAIIPAASPPMEGNATIPAHAVNIGATGNIGARDINAGCCGQGILAVNSNPFHGGAEARDFTFVTGHDIAQSSLSLTKVLTQGFSHALDTQLQSGESAIPPTCNFSTQSDHPVGFQEASVTVTVAGNCKSVLYSKYALQNEADTLLAAHAKRFGNAYTSLDGQQVQVVSQTMVSSKNTIAAITTKATGAWGYQFSKGEEEHIKKLVAGKSRTEAMNILAAIPGIQRAIITGIGQSDVLPTDTAHITVMFLYIVH
ncbi:MAG TPA: hypothetical protein VNG51_24375 [Ktedonobacteraceae bacterium]|nr:hypothetical protein [Ktedonobacteraceae bacterium]